MSKSASKIKLNSFDDLFGYSVKDSEPADDITVQELPLSELHEFNGHPFKVLDDAKMQETVESIKNYGVLMPGIARPRAGGGYEIIAGHRRRRGCELAGLATIPMFVRHYTDDEATIIMVDTNIQREDISHSEKAKAYKMKYEAMKHQGKKGIGASLSEVGKAANDNAKKVQRYIWLARLTDELLEMVDNKQLDFMAGVNISFLSVENQKLVLQVIKERNAKISVPQAEELKLIEQQSDLTLERIYEICQNGKKPNAVKKVASATHQEATAAGMTVEEYAANGYEPREKSAEQSEHEYIMSPRERQQQEITTIKERNVVLNLSDADCDRLARKAGAAGISIGELLEGFIGDLVGGTYAHGSDEEYLAKQWFDRCGFREFQKKTLLNNMIAIGYDVDTFLNVCDNIKLFEEDIIKSKEHPEEYDPEEITYLEDTLEYYRNEFNNFTKEFRSDHEAADMDKEIEICRKWRDDFANLKVPEQQEYKR